MRLTGFLLWACALWCAGCASTTSKGGELVPFADEGFLSGAPSGRPVRVAVLVGIDEFEDDAFPALSFAGADAKAMAAALGEFDHTIVLTGDETDRADIWAALDRASSLLSHPNSSLLVYFSTHGTLERVRADAGLSRFLVVRDTRVVQLRRTGVSVDELLDHMDALPAKKTALILATCHSGSGKSRLGGELARQLEGVKSGPPRLDDVSEATFVLSASAFWEVAREDARLEHDIYTYFFVEALTKRQDADADGAITLEEAHHWARTRTYAYSGGAQRPSAVSMVVGQDPFVLVGERSETPRPVIYGYGPRTKGLELRVGEGRGVLPGMIATEPGRQRVVLRERGGETLYERELTLSSGDRFDITSLLPPERRFAFDVGGGAASSFSRDSAPLFGVSPLVWAAARGVNVPWRRGYIGGDAALIVGSGVIDFDGESLPYQWLMGRLGGSLGAYVLDSGGWRVGLGGVLGGQLMRRRFDTTSFQDTERAFGVHALSNVELVRAIRSAGALAVSLRGGVLWVDYAGRELQPTAELSLSWRFEP